MNIDEITELVRGGYKAPPVPPAIRDDMTEVELCCHLLRYPQYIDAEDRVAIEKDYSVFMVVWKNKPFITVRNMISRLTSLTAENIGELNKVVITFEGASLGYGQVVSETVALKLEAGHSLQAALSSTYCVCAKDEVAKQLRDRLLCRKFIPLDNLDELESIVTRNIVWHDPLAYDLSFNGTNFTDAEVEKMKSYTPAEVEAKTKYNFPWM